MMMPLHRCQTLAILHLHNAYLSNPNVYVCRRYCHCYRHSTDIVSIGSHIGFNRFVTGSNSFVI